MTKTFIIAVALTLSTLAVTPIVNSQDETDRPQQEGERPPRPDFSAAAETLGISEEDLHAALRASGGPPPNLAKAAETLGITEEALKAALPEPKHPPRRPR